MDARHVSGFSLVELMVTVTLVGMLLVVGLPMYKTVQRNAILASVVNEFIASLNFARSEAIKRSTYVTMKNETGNWEDGWKIFTDVAQDGVFDVDEDLPLHVHEPLHVGYTLRGNNNLKNRISFKASGQGNTMGSFVVCDNTDRDNIPESGESKLIVINILGRVTRGVDSNGNGIPEKITGDGAKSDLTSCL